MATLHRFHGTDGKAPNAALVQSSDGKFYGTTTFGGAHTFGTVFSIGSGGALTTLHSFIGSDGKFPYAPLLQAADGSFYGTASEGGIIIKSECPSGCGTIFKLTSTGAFLGVLHFFCPFDQQSCPDGADPFAGLVQATDGNFYGTTAEGGPNNSGVIFKFTPGVPLTTLYSFCTCCCGGAYPSSAMVQGTDGNLYGTAPSGGNSSHPGTVFALSTGLAPFVKTVQTAGRVGSPIIILGTDLSGATRVAFNGTPASFTVVSATEVTATVPAGATTGKIRVVTTSGTLLSNLPFRVLP